MPWCIWLQYLDSAPGASFTLLYSWEAVAMVPTTHVGLNSWLLALAPSLAVGSIWRSEPVNGNSLSICFSVRQIIIILPVQAKVYFSSHQYLLSRLLGLLTVLIVVNKRKSPTYSYYLSAFLTSVWGISAHKNCFPLQKTWYMSGRWALHICVK